MRALSLFVFVGLLAAASAQSSRTTTTTSQPSSTTSAIWSRPTMIAQGSPNLVAYYYGTTCPSNGLLFGYYFPTVPCTAGANLGTCNSADLLDSSLSTKSFCYPTTNNWRKGYPDIFANFTSNDIIAIEWYATTDECNKQVNPALVTAASGACFNINNSTSFRLECAADRKSVQAVVYGTGSCTGGSSALTFLPDIDCNGEKARLTCSRYNNNTVSNINGGGYGGDAWFWWPTYGGQWLYPGGNAYVDPTVPVYPGPGGSGITTSRNTTTTTTTTTKTTTTTAAPPVATTSNAAEGKAAAGSVLATLLTILAWFF